jgi:hypothetical protein
MNLHDELGNHGADAAAEMARRLESAEVRVTLTDRVRRGRRRRALGGAGTVAAVALVAVGAFALLPLGEDASDPLRPAGVVSAGPYEYEVAADSREADPEVTLRGDSAVMCADTLHLTAGLTVHDPSAFTGSIALSALLTTLGETTDMTPPATPVPIDPGKPDGLTTGWDPDTPTWSVQLGGEVRSYELVSLLMDGGTVEGIAFGMSGGGDASGPRWASGGTPIPNIGQCDQSLDAISGEPGDPMRTVLVAQFWGAATSTGGGTPLLATIVIDPTQPPVFFTGVSLFEENGYFDDGDTSGQ